jgi:AraC family transcriptional regulator, regulatory protein of adaptative response / methylated-DNA-[protein]-cysteine methyltransferase
LIFNTLQYNLSQRYSFCIARFAFGRRALRDLRNRLIVQIRTRWLRAKERGDFMLKIPDQPPETGPSIACALIETSLGLLLTAGGEHGVSAIFLADGPEPLLNALHARFSPREVTEGGEEFRRYAAAAARLAERPQAPCEFPLSIERGTPFQRLVWRALCDIPAGATASYAEIARCIGMPKAVRAVAAACAANNIAVAIPCHRVLRSDGDISGYRWGVERKRELLRREGVAA